VNYFRQCICIRHWYSISYPLVIRDGIGSFSATAILTADGHIQGNNWTTVAVGTNTWTTETAGTNTWTTVPTGTNTWLRKG